MTNARVSVLVIDDDVAIRRLLRVSLTARDFNVIEASDGQSARQLMGRTRPDLVILDLGLPDIGGVELLRQIRAASPVPIVVLSNQLSTATKVETLELGASDYITKPFNVDELAARLRVALRHSFQEQGVHAAFINGDLTVDLVRRRVTVGSARVQLSPTEFAILRLLVTHAGKVLTHDQILRECWKGDKEIEHLRVYIGQLRKKLESDPHNPRYVITIPGVGYQLLSAD